MWCKLLLLMNVGDFYMETFLYDKNTLCYKELRALLPFL